MQHLRARNSYPKKIYTPLALLALLSILPRSMPWRIPFWWGMFSGFRPCGHRTIPVLLQSTQDFRFPTTDSHASKGIQRSTGRSRGAEDGTGVVRARGPQAHSRAWGRRIESGRGISRGTAPQAHFHSVGTEMGRSGEEPSRGCLGLSPPKGSAVSALGVAWRFACLAPVVPLDSVVRGRPGWTCRRKTWHERWAPPSGPLPMSCT